MARQITPSTVGMILSAILSLGILGFCFYQFALVAKVEAVADKSRKFETEIINSELNPQNEKSVFIQTVNVSTPTLLTSGEVTYTADELGKKDITQAGL